MLYYIYHNGVEHKVRVESKQNRIVVSCNEGPEERADLVYHGFDCSFIREHKVFHANVVGNKNDYTVWLPAGTLNFFVESEYKRIVHQMLGQHLEDDSQIKSKMPGKVVRILVSEGQEVKEGENVLVMEAMKMENEIPTPIAGKVKNIVAEDGQTVETGALLLEIDPIGEKK